MPRAAVLGSPISHSLSPTLHQAAYRHLGLDWNYTAIECTAAEFPEFFAQLGDEWRGLSLTMPLKEVVLEVVHEVSEIARAVHSANTVYRPDAHTPWHATNTDIEGIERALREVGVDSASTARILGAGATARSAVAALSELGVDHVVVHARRVEAARDVAALGERWGVRCDVSDLAPQDLACDVLVSTLPADAAEAWARSVVPGTTALLDASYHPWPTPLAATWHAHGSTLVASGRDMLVWQAVAQVRLMTGAHFDDLALAAAMRAAL